jgi:lipopolysaccharide biosynthesis glycosyltransferase
MRHINEFLRSEGLDESCFLVIGKGPTFSKLDEFDCSQHIKVALNHVVREIDVFIAHAIDFDVVLDCAQRIDENAKFLLMPYYPHFSNRATFKNLRHLVKENYILEKLNNEGRLLWYNFGSSRLKKIGYPSVGGGFFSGDVIFGVLASAGVKNIKTIGVDGGGTYGGKFLDLSKKTLLVNGRASFDIQFSKIRDHIMKHDLEFARLDESYPIKVYVATTEAQMLATKVLEYSIRKNTVHPVKFIAIHKCGLDYPEPKDIENRQRTPFSFQRFLIPKLNQWKGKAIYLDSDMQVFEDINKLWTLPMGSNDLLTVRPAKGEGRRLHFSVMLLNCDKLNWDIENIIDRLNVGELSYTSLMHEMKVAKAIAPDINEDWNSLEKYDPSRTCLIHYTDMDTQPWVSTKNPNEAVWMRDLLEAVDSGAISYDYVRSHVEKGWVRPGILFQLDNGLESSNKMTSDVLKKDRDFHPPYEELVCGRSPTANTTLNQVKVKLKKLWRSYASS